MSSFQETISNLLKLSFKDKKTKSKYKFISCCVYHESLHAYHVFFHAVNSDAVKLSSDYLYIFVLGKANIESN